VEELRELTELHGIPFNTDGWAALVDKYAPDDAGYAPYNAGDFPVLIRGVPEGTVVSPGTVVATIVNTDPEFPWLTSFFETLFLRCVWYPSTVASISRACKVVIKQGMIDTGADLSTLPFKLHDFGARGVSSGESAGIGGMGHLINFQGTDTLEAIKYVRENYGEQMAGFSIPATEHSTVTSWGRDEEGYMFRSFVKNNLAPGVIAACVSDSYDIWESLGKWKELEPEIKASGGTLVVRPDSGDPVETPVKVIEELMKLFGYTTNEAGYKVLPSYIRVIQGDGIDLQSITSIIGLLKAKWISVDNIAFGMGGGLLQHCDRDTFGWAMKCSAAKVNGQWRDVYKDPIGGSKTSKRGLVTSGRSFAGDLALDADVQVDTDDDWVTYYNGATGYLRDADSWADIKARAEVA
jgi:nicotinamide phosphoribosyltransferase